MPSGWTLAAALALNGTLTALLLASLPARLGSAGLMRTNYAGHQVVTACGVVLVLGAIPGLALLMVFLPSQRVQAAVLLTVLVGFGVLGFADDRWGSPAAKGLRGHLRKLFHERVITSGLVKAVGGVIVALTAAGLTGLNAGLSWIVPAAIVALSANACNLLDLRPGRASACALLVFALCMAALWWRGLTGELACVACIVLPAAILYLPDARARIMLGDAGSNPLGACVGAALVFALPQGWAWYAPLGALIAVHIAAERWSLSAVIEATPVLRRMDRWTGVRD